MNDTIELELELEYNQRLLANSVMPRSPAIDAHASMCDVDLVTKIGVILGVTQHGVTR